MAISALTAALMAGGTGLTLGSMFGGSKDSGGKSIKLEQTAEQREIEKWLLSLTRKEEVFAPRKIAGLTTAEQQAVDLVKKIMQRGIPGVGEAVEATRRTMTEPLTPENVPGVSGLFAKASELGARTLGRTKRGLAMAGNLPSESSTGERVFGRTWQDIQNEFITSAYPFYQQGLAAKYAAPGQLANLATQQVTTPLSLATTVGAQPRTIQQQINDAIFEATRKTQEFPYTTQAGIGAQILGRESHGYQPGYMEPSMFQTMAPIIGQLGSAAIKAGGKGGGGYFNPPGGQFNLPGGGYFIPSGY